MSKPDSNENPWRALGLVGLIGLDIAICTLLGYFGGAFLGGRFGGEAGWVIAGVLFGVAAGLVNVVFIVKRFLEDT